MNFEQNHKQCVDKLIWATKELRVEIEPTQLSKIAELIVQTMTGPWRYFHSTEHIFEVGGGEKPIEVLAALFHDVVYVQVDQSVNFNLSYYINPFIKQSRDSLVIREESELPTDSIFEMVASTFGFTPGQILSPYQGENEFLSALVGAKVLEPFFKASHILQIIACIEATIPFQSRDEEGLTSSDRLYLRLRKTNQKFDIGMSEAELVDTVKSSVRLSNRDVGSFAYPSSARFLDCTWSLLPETNHNLENANSYTANQYRVALQKMAGFMNFLKPEVVFKRFKEEPDEQTYNRMVDMAKRNIEIAKLYLGSKLFTIAIIEALSLRIGQGIALSIMVGELPTFGFSGCRLVNFIPNVPNSYPPKTDIELEVLHLLQVGRIKSSTYDIKNSPLATFTAKSIGFDGIRQMMDIVQEFFQGNVSSEDFLSRCNPNVTETVIEGILQLLDTRKALLCMPRNTNINTSISQASESRILSQ